MPWLDLITMVVFMLLGSCDIGFAIYHFQKKQYIRFGLMTMLAIQASAEVVQFAFKY